MIKITYSTVDGCRIARSFKTIKGARTFAHHWLGETPDMGRFYAVSDDGVGKIKCEGCTLYDLFPKTILGLSHPPIRQGEPGTDDYFDYIDNMRQADAGQQDRDRDAVSHRDLWELPF